MARCKVPQITPYGVSSGDVYLVRTSVIGVRVVPCDPQPLLAWRLIGAASAGLILYAPFYGAPQGMLPDATGILLCIAGILFGFGWPARQQGWRVEVLTWSGPILVYWSDGYEESCVVANSLISTLFPCQ